MGDVPDVADSPESKDDASEDSETAADLQKILNYKEASIYLEVKRLNAASVTSHCLTFRKDQISSLLTLPGTDQS